MLHQPSPCSRTIAVHGLLISIAVHGLLISIAVHGLLSIVASLVVEHGL